MPRLELRCTDSEKELYVQAAVGEGLSLSAWVKLACAVRAGGVTVSRSPAAEVAPLFTAAVEKSGVGPSRRPKSGLCPHRVAAGSFCKRCEEG